MGPFGEAKKREMVIPQNRRKTPSALGIRGGEPSGFLQDFLPGQKTVDGFSRSSTDVVTGREPGGFSCRWVGGFLVIYDGFCRALRGLSDGFGRFRYDMLVFEWTSCGWCGVKEGSAGVFEYLLVFSVQGSHIRRCFPLC